MKPWLLTDPDLRVQRDTAAPALSVPDVEDTVSDDLQVIGTLRADSARARMVDPITDESNVVRVVFSLQARRTTDDGESSHGDVMGAVGDLDNVVTISALLPDDGASVDAAPIDDMSPGGTGPLDRECAVHVVDAAQ